LRYVPNPIAEEFINFGVVLVEEGGFAGVRFCDLRRVSRLDPHADLDLLQAFQNDIRGRLGNAAERNLLLQTFVDSLSNMLQILGPKACLTSDPEKELDSLTNLYLCGL
jgi:hypothetical protein